MDATEYRVRCSLYQGPMDLLVYLVRRQEVDVMSIRIAKIIDEFLEFMAVLQLLDLDMIGDFIVMASTLIEVKSRNALPTPEDETSTDEEFIETGGDDLIHQLMEYKRFKEAAGALEEHAAEWQERYPRLSDDRPRHGKDPALDLIRDVELWDLVSALSRILRRADPDEQASIRYDDTPIGVYSERIRKSIAVAGRVAFSDLFAGENKRSRIVGLFLAILELLRHHGYRAEQPVMYGEIWVLPPVPGYELDSIPSGTSADELTMPESLPNES
jgi:segregation and condensation protein A